MNPSRTSSWKFWLLLAGTLVALGISYGPLLERFFRGLWSRSHYQYFPFVLGAFGWLVWQRYQLGTPRDCTKRKWLGMREGALFATAWGSLTIAYFADSPWLAAVSAIVLLAGFLLRLSRERTIRNLWGIWGLLWLIIPLPMNRDQVLIAALQRWSSRLSSILLDWVGIPHLMTGNILQLSEKQLFVDEACSGIVSILSIVSCAVIYSVWQNRGLLHLVLLTLAGMGWATLMNVMRISTIAFAFDRWGVDWSEGWQHELLGLALFSLTFLSLMSTDALLRWGMSPIASIWEAQHGAPLRFGQRLVTWWDKMAERAAAQTLVNSQTEEAPAELPAKTAKSRPQFVLGIVALVAFGMLGGMQYGYGDWLADTEREQTLNSQNALVLENGSQLDEDVLPAKYDSFNRTTFKKLERETDDVFGKYSRMYEYRNAEANTLLVSCDYPFGGSWHDLTICYQGVGWQTLGTQIILSDSSREGEKWNYVEVDFLGRDGTKAFLVFCQFDEYGVAAEPPSSSYLNYVWQRLLRPVGSAQGRQFFQIQVWTTGLGDVSDEEKEVARDLLLESRERLRDFITKSN